MEVPPHFSKGRLQSEAPLTGPLKGSGMCRGLKEVAVHSCSWSRRSDPGLAASLLPATQRAELARPMPAPALAEPPFNLHVD